MPPEQGKHQAVIRTGQPAAPPTAPPGRCAGVDQDGALLLETAQGVQRILAGDLSLRLA